MIYTPHIHLKQSRLFLLFIIRVKWESKRVYRNGCRYNERLNTETGGPKTPHIHWVARVYIKQVVVYYKSRKRELKAKLMNELVKKSMLIRDLSCLLWMNKAKVKDKIYMGCRCYERLQPNTKEFTRLEYTEVVLELEHLKIETRLITEMFVNVMGECENEMR